MSRLTYHEMGEFGVIGINTFNCEKKLHERVMKLKDYEDTGLAPDEIIRMRTVDKAELASVYAENGELHREMRKLKAKVLTYEQIVKACDRIVRENEKLKEENNALRKQQEEEHKILKNVLEEMSR